MMPNRSLAALACVQAALVILVMAIPVMASPATAEDQQVLKEFTTPAPVPGGPIWVTLLTDRTAEALWRGDAARSTLQIEAASTGTCFYVMGLATRPMTVKPSVTAQQDGKQVTGSVVNVSHLDGQAIPMGGVLLGLLEFSDKLDASKPIDIDFAGVTTTFVVPADLVSKWGTVTRPSGKGY